MVKQLMLFTLDAFKLGKTLSKLSGKHFLWSNLAWTSNIAGTLLEGGKVTQMGMEKHTECKAPADHPQYPNGIADPGTLRC
jgi:hypothetical protein